MAAKRCSPPLRIGQGHSWQTASVRNGLSSPFRVWGNMGCGDLPHAKHPTLMADRNLRCAFLTYFPYWPGEALLACRGLELVAFEPGVVGLPPDPNPFGLEEHDHADVALVSAWWHRWLYSQHPERADEVMRAIERHADVVVGLDGPDRFGLTFPPAAMDRFGIVVKFQGVYRDRDLYNYVVGPQYDGANWTEKVRPQRERYSTAMLEKLRLSVPSFLTEFPAVRRRTRERETTSTRMGRRHMSQAERVARNLAEAVVPHAIGIANGRGRTLDVHCLTGLSHVQRIEAIRRLEGLSGTLGIAPTQGVAPSLISGTEYGGEDLPPDVAAKLAAEANAFARAPRGRLGFLLDLRRHRVAVAPTGYGEIGNRHGLALMSGAALVCQDVRHVDMMLPLVDRENVMFCRPDLSDLRRVVEELLADDALRQRIGTAGRRSWLRWARDSDVLLYSGLEAHIREVV